ncbi:MAG: 6-carboxytetrahydropterin synthase [Flavobacteriales bacterium]|nr:6-carboxytetrahydropterin synthase [Flavobacteriales bacterium]
MIHITRRERFNAAHKLYNENWSKEKNEQVFGKCANANWHGHNFDLIVTVKGEVNPDTGFVINLKDLSAMIQEHVIEKVDHKNLNLDVDFMSGKLPSTEILAMEFWKILAPLVSNEGGELHCIKLIETENNYVQYFGN